MQYPTSDLFRHADIAPNSEGRFAGYAAVFNTPTLIDSWEGRFVEQFHPGAFRNTLQQRGDRIPLLFNHGFDPTTGEIPIASDVVLVEDHRGLRVEGKMLQHAAAITEALEAGALNGMSFRFSVVRDEWDTATAPETRTVKEAKLHEVSVVTFPAYEATSAGVRTARQYHDWRSLHLDQIPNQDDDRPADSGSPDSAPADSGRAQRERRLDYIRRQVTITTRR